MITPKNKQTYKFWIDFTKAVAAFMVLFQHSISHIWTSTSPDSLLWKTSHFPFIFSRIAVLLFIMCSGATILQKERTPYSILRHNIFPLLKVYFSWMMIYGIYECILLYKDDIHSFQTYLNAIIKSVLFGHYHTWFIFTIIGLYLITPFLYPIIRNLESTKYFLILSMVFTIVIPALRSFPFLDRLSDNLSNFNMNFVLGYILYYVLGYYISCRGWNKQYQLICFIVFLISYSLSSLLTFYFSMEKNMATQELLGDFSILTFLTTISFFSLLKSLENYKFFPIFSKIAYLGLALYLMHPIFLVFIQMITDFKIFIVIPVFYVFCIIICYLISKNKLLSHFLLK